MSSPEHQPRRNEEHEGVFSVLLRALRFFAVDVHSFRASHTAGLTTIPELKMGQRKWDGTGRDAAGRREGKIEISACVRRRFR
jgi:hypothetical protein